MNVLYSYFKADADSVVDIIVKLLVLKSSVSVLRKLVDKGGKLSALSYVFYNLCCHRVHLGVEIISFFGGKSSLLCGYAGKLLLYYLDTLLGSEAVDIVKERGCSRERLELCSLIVKAASLF